MYNTLPGSFQNLQYSPFCLGRICIQLNAWNWNVRVRNLGNGTAFDTVMRAVKFLGSQSCLSLFPKLRACFCKSGDSRCNGPWIHWAHIDFPSRVQISQNTSQQILPTTVQPCPSKASSTWHLSPLPKQENSICLHLDATAVYITHPFPF